VDCSELWRAARGREDRDAQGGRTRDNDSRLDREAGGGLDHCDGESDEYVGHRAVLVLLLTLTSQRPSRTAELSR